MTDGTAPAPPGASGPRISRGLVAVITATTIAMLSVLGWLFGPAASEPPAPVNVDALPSVDGTVVVVDLPRLVLKAFRPLDGRREIEFTVPEAQRSNFDVAHLRSHSSIGLPTRIYYVREGDRYLAVYKEDAPANSSREGGS